jgi:predicted oxidoreductase
MKSKEKIQFSPYIVGAMRLGEWGVKMSSQELEKFIDGCLDLGLKDFDHADIYGHYTEEVKLGEVIKRRPDLKSKIQITTKCGIKLITPNRPNHTIKSYDSTREHIIQSAENSLKALSIEAIDLLLIHRPDYLMDASEIAAAFSDLKEAGKVKHFGVSNFTPSQFELLSSFTPLVTNQLEISVLHRNAFEDGTLDQCQKYNIQPTAWSPLGGGALFGVTADESIIRIQKVLAELGEKHQASPDQLLYAWLLKHPAKIVPVLGTTKLERVKAAIEAREMVLSHEDWYTIWEAAIGEEVA